jgi:hypothetical protein
MPQWVPQQLVTQVVAAVIAAIGFWLKANLDRRDAAKRYDGELSRAKSEVETITTWLQAYRLVGQDERVGHANKSAESDLESVYARIAVARAHFYRASAREGISPHYAMAAVATILFFVPTGILAVAYAILTSAALRSENLELARRRSRMVVRWFWVSAAIFPFIMVIWLLSVEPG